MSKTLIIANALTQEFYGRDGDLYVSYIALKSCLETIARTFDKDTELHIPYLIGAGLGGGDAEKILRIIDVKLKDHNVNFHHWK